MVNTALQKGRFDLSWSSLAMPYYLEGFSFDIKRWEIIMKLPCSKIFNESLKLKLMFQVFFHVSPAYLFKHMVRNSHPHLPVLVRLIYSLPPLSLNCIFHIVHTIIFIRKNHYITFCGWLISSNSVSSSHQALLKRHINIFASNNFTWINSIT